MINEIFFIRAVACISVVLIHGFGLTMVDFNVVDNPDMHLQHVGLAIAQILLMFGTPVFIFISEFIIAHKYKNKTPDGFLSKRVKFILLPYLAMGVLYTLVRASGDQLSNIEDLVILAVKVIIFGEFHGYFILVIFQFYLLHNVFVSRIVERFSAKQIIITSFFINVLYLGFFNFIEPASIFGGTNETLEFIWDRFSVLPFVAWVFYFVVAFYCGRNVNSFRKSLQKHKIIVLAATIVTAVIVLSFCYTGILTTITSKRFDILLYTVSITFFLFYIASKIKKTPKFLMIISQYSFGIYLLHPFFHTMVAQKLSLHEFSISNLAFNIILYLVIGVMLPIVSTFLLNKTVFGPYIIGKVGTHNKGVRVRRVTI